MSRTQPHPLLTPAISSLPTAHPAGIVANLFRSTACIEEALHQSGSDELQYLEGCWTDSAILQFILLGWIGLVLKIVLFVLVATFLAACVQGRRPWYVFVSFVKGGRRIAGGLCGCFELDDEVREGDAERGLGIVWQEEGGDGGYFGSPKEKLQLN